MNYIELFAGCGGLSLGLESEGFELLFANELSPMAAETYAYNLLGQDIASGLGDAPNVLWLRSQYPRTAGKLRLSENPSTHIPPKMSYSDLTDEGGSKCELRRGSLLVGSILDLNKIVSSKNWGKQFRELLGEDEVDVVSGGPPCQSFSMAGLRQKANSRNSLPWAFADFVSKFKPKIAVLENVTGILRAFKNEDQRYFAWYEVAKAFSMEGYVPLCLHVNAKLIGAAQNRPRFIMLAFRRDLVEPLIKNLPTHSAKALTQGLHFSEMIKTHSESLEYGYLDYHDVSNRGALGGIFSEPPLCHLATNLIGESFVSVKEAIDDLEPGGEPASDYVERINSLLLCPKERIKLNHELSDSPLQHERRQNSLKVQSRFRLYQMLRDLTKRDPDHAKNISTYLRKGDDSLLKPSALQALSAIGPWKPLDGGPQIEGIRPSHLLTEIKCLRTRKQTQRALSADNPAPAALSIPDDACHYREGITRTLTVREMARIQSFPDWFAFRSKVTTGGQLRKFQVPQYTQVGNAVPPLLGKAIGKTCREFLELVSQ